MWISNNLHIYTQVLNMLESITQQSWLCRLLNAKNVAFICVCVRVAFGRDTSEVGVRFLFLSNFHCGTTVLFLYALSEGSQ